MLNSEFIPTQQELEARLPTEYQKVLNTIRRHPGLVMFASKRFSYLRSLPVCVSTLSRFQIRKSVAALARMRLISAHKPQFAETSEPPRWYDSQYQFPKSAPLYSVPSLGVKTHVDFSEQTWTPPKAKPRSGSVGVDSSLMATLEAKSAREAKRSLDSNRGARAPRSVAPAHVPMTALKNRSALRKQTELNLREILQTVEPGKLMYGVDLHEAIDCPFYRFKQAISLLRAMGVSAQAWIPPWEQKMGYRLVMPSEKVFSLGDAVVYLPSTRSEKFGTIIDFKPHPTRPDQSCPVIQIEGGCTQFGSDDVLFKLLELSA